MRKIMDSKTEAEKILKSMEQELPLIPPDRTERWVEYLRFHYQRFIDTVSVLPKEMKGGSVLEVGSTPGHFTILLKRLGYDVHGVDIDPSRLQGLWDKYSIPVRKADIETDELPFPSNSFDVILFTEILEHLRINVLFTLREVFRVLKPKGKLILSTPNISPVQRIYFVLGVDYQGDIVKAFESLELTGHMGHIRLYSFKEVKRLLEYVGFRIISHTYLGPMMPLRWKGKIFRLFYPRKEHFRPYLFVTAEKE